MTGRLTSVGRSVTHTEEFMETQVYEAFALQAAHRLEVSLLQAHIERLRAALREHGHPAPRRGSPPGRLRRRAPGAVQGGRSRRLRSPG